MVLYDFTASSSSATVPRPVSSSATAALPDASRWLPATSLPVCAGVPAGQQFRHGAHWQLLRYGALASNKPHPSERSTPVWLAIWRPWAGFANSQLRCANFPALIYIYASIPIAATLESLLRQTQIFRPICTDCLRHLRISAK